MGNLPLDFPLHIPVEWLVRSLVLASMLLQLFLATCGGFRYLSSSFILGPVLWVIYISADAVAITALGLMLHSAHTPMYGVWAPMLLLHLGGPDSITAYSTVDNELWLRHGFHMIYQVSMAAYVIYVSPLQGYLFAAAILLFITGAFKYAERTAALRFASYTQIEDSTQPIYEFMQHEDDIDREIGRVEYNYLVIGDEQIQKKRSENGNAPMPSWKSMLEAKGIVTMKNVWEQEGLQTTDNYILCLSHALFKMYKRRFVSLYFHEVVRPKTRRLFFNQWLSSEKVFKIVEMELKFMYDILFSKSSGTAFSQWGALTRLLNACLLGAAAFWLLFGLKVEPAQKIVTYVLVSAALGVEVIQLCRIVVSDWTMVRLICAYIVHFRRPSRGGWHIFKLLQIAMPLLGKIRKRLGDTYCKNAVNQYSVIDACSTSSPHVWKAAGCISMLRGILVPFYIKARHVKEETLQNDLKVFMFEKLKVRCSLDQDIATCRGRVYGYDECLVTMGCKELLWASELDMEDLILTWHLATTICEKRRSSSDREPNNEDPNFQFSRTLSRYCAYLLVSRPHLLPLPVYIAKISFIKIHYEILELPKDVSTWSLEETTKTPLGFGKRLARQLLEKPEEERWEILSEYWAGLLIYMAVYHKAPLHAECLAGGGEFLSKLWALLGHVGCGEQSDTAVSKKREEKSKKEKEEDEKKRMTEEDNWKEEERNRRNEEEKKWRIQQRRKNRTEEQRIMRREKQRSRKLGETLTTMTEKSSRYMLK